MIRHRWLVRGCATVFLATLVGCSGDRFDDGDSLIQGIVFLPAANRCAGCSSAAVPVTLIVMKQGESQGSSASGLTTARGVYTLQLDPADPNSAPPDTNGDGKQTVAAFAAVNDQGALIGGVFSTRSGAAASKDFTPTTQIAYVASSLLTSGGQGPGCVVSDECSGFSNCFATIDPDTLDTNKINNLEQAASYISADVYYGDSFSNDSPGSRSSSSSTGSESQAACAVIVCTDGGDVAASEECVREQFGEPSGSFFICDPCIPDPNEEECYTSCVRFCDSSAECEDVCDDSCNGCGQGLGCLECERNCVHEGSTRCAPPDDLVECVDGEY